MPVIPPYESREDGQVALYARTVVGDPDNPPGSPGGGTSGICPERRRLEAVRVYFETPSARSWFHEMMVDATGEDPPFRQILVYDMDQFSRWADGLIALRDRLETNGATAASVTGEPATKIP